MTNPRNQRMPAHEIAVGMALISPITHAPVYTVTAIKHTYLGTIIDKVILTVRFWDGNPGRRIFHANDIILMALPGDIHA